MSKAVYTAWISICASKVELMCYPVCGNIADACDWYPYDG